MKDYFLRGILGAVVFTLFAIFVCGSYSIAKHFSYAWFYKDMVIETPHEQVHSEALK